MSPASKPLDPETLARLRLEYDRDWRRQLRRARPPKERLLIARQAMPERDAAARSRDFGEVNGGFGAEAARREAGRCLDCAVPGCVAGCPVAIDIPTFVKRIETGEFEAAGRTLRETNSLPAVCGRVCPQETQCELTCVMGKKFKPVAIGRLERFASDYALFEEQLPVPAIAPPSGKKVAVVGAGPAGITVAGDLVKLGHAFIRCVPKITYLCCIGNAVGILEIEHQVYKIVCVFCV